MNSQIFNFISIYENGKYFGPPGAIGINSAKFINGHLSTDNWYETKEICTFCQKEYLRSELNYRIEFSGKSLSISDYNPRNYTYKYPNTADAINVVCQNCTNLCQLLIENINEVPVKFDFNIELYKNELDYI